MAELRRLLNYISTRNQFTPSINDEHILLFLYVYQHQSHLF